MPGLGMHCGKKETAAILKHYQDYYGEAYDFFPKSFLLPEEKSKLEQAMHNKKGTWIVKPSDGAEGCGITLA